ncbi:MAG TPA: T9SS type A sorting domain-containing protein, partial [Rhodothermales bacterium]|nr:T9SS type A sorting domain-containing protein [Rhodothermales bacterium]
GHVHPLLGWTHVDTLATYQLQIFRDSVGSNIVFADLLLARYDVLNSCKWSAEEFCIYGPCEEGSFDWRVRAILDADTSAWSELWRLTLVPSVGTEDVTTGAMGLSFEAFPNPSLHTLSVETSVSDAGNYRFSITTLLGQEVLGRKVFLSANTKATMSVDVGHLSVGVYMVRLTGSDGVAATRKLVIQ